MVSAPSSRLRRDGEQPRQAEREQIAALRRDQRMQFIEDHALERAEQEWRIVGGEHAPEFGRDERSRAGLVEHDVAEVVLVQVAGDAKHRLRCRVVVFGQYRGLSARSDLAPRECPRPFPDVDLGVAIAVPQRE